MTSVGATLLTRPRARITLAALASAVAVTVSACGSEDSAPALPPLGPAVQPPKAAANAPVPDTYALRGELLEAAQLPDGYAALTDPAPGSISGAGSTTTPAQCAKVLAPIAEQAPNAATRAAATFGGLDFASIDIDAAAYTGEGAAQAFTAVQALLRECGTYSGKDADDTRVEFRVGGLEQPGAGDASIAYRVNTASQGLTLYSAVSITLVGATVVQIAMSAAKEVDAQQLSALTAAQVRKLRGEAGP